MKWHRDRLLGQLMILRNKQTTTKTFYSWLLSARLEHERAVNDSIRQSDAALLTERFNQSMSLEQQVHSLQQLVEQLQDSIQSHICPSTRPDDELTNQSTTTSHNQSHQHVEEEKYNEPPASQPSDQSHLILNQLTALMDRLDQSNQPTSQTVSHPVNQIDDRLIDLLMHPPRLIAANQVAHVEVQDITPYYDYLPHNASTHRLHYPSNNQENYPSINQPRVMSTPQPRRHRPCESRSASTRRAVKHVNANMTIPPFKV